MIITLQKIQCWDPGSGFNVFLDKSAEIDLSTLTTASPHYVQVGPYRVKIEVESGGGVFKSVKIGGAKTLVGSGNAVSGSVFMFLNNEVERVSMDGTFNTLGSASGCFEIHW